MRRNSFFKIVLIAFLLFQAKLLSQKVTGNWSVASSTSATSTATSALGNVTVTAKLSGSKVTFGGNQNLSTLNWYSPSTMSNRPGLRMDLARGSNATLTLTFSAPVTNPVLHVNGWGAKFGSKAMGPYLNFGSHGISKLAGTSDLSVAGSIATVANCSRTDLASDWSTRTWIGNNSLRLGEQAGSIQINGTNLTSVSIQITRCSDTAGTNPDWTSFALTLPECSMTISPSTGTVCSGTAIPTFTIAGVAASSVTKWQYSSNGGSTWIDWGGAGSLTSPSGTFTSAGTWQFRAVNSNGSCPYSPVASYTVNSTTASTTISPSSGVSILNGSIPVFTLSDVTAGSVQKWQYSSNGGSTWTDWGNAGSLTSPSTGIFTSSGTWQFRAMLNGGCATSSVASYTVSNNPCAVTISGPASICSGSSATLSASLVSSSGTNTYLWSTGATTSSITVSPTSTTTYTLSVNGGQCTASNTLSVTGGPAISSITPASQTVCQNGTATNLTVTASNATSYQWYVNNSLISGATSSSYTPDTSVPGSYSYQVVVLGGSGCNAITSEAMDVIVKQNPEIQGGKVVCSNAFLQLYGKSNTLGNHVFTGIESVSFGTIDLSTSTEWSTDRLSTPGYFSAVGTASYTGGTDNNNINGYVKHYADATDQAFTFPVGSGADLRTLSISGTRNASSTIAVAWIPGNPCFQVDVTNSNSTHSIYSVGSGIDVVSAYGQWDWQDLSSNFAGTVTVSIPNLSGFADNAANLRLVGWDGSQWINLSGGAGASGLAEGSTLSGTMVSGIQAIGIGTTLRSLSGVNPDSSTTVASSLGSWSSSDLSVASISANGLVTPVAAGTTNVTYTVNGCSVTETITVNAASTITGVATLCKGSKTSYNTTDSNGTWVSSNTAVATIDASTGLLTAVGVGTTYVYYKSTTCCTSTPLLVTVTDVPVISQIAGNQFMCIGSAGSDITVTSTGGTSVSFYANTVDSNTGGTLVGTNLTGVFTPPFGTIGTTYYYAVVSNGSCSATSGTVRVEIGDCTCMSTITGYSAPICVGGTVSLSGSGSPALTNAWFSETPAIATVSSTGLVTGLLIGNAVIVYTDSNGCVAKQVVAVKGPSKPRVLVTPPDCTTPGSGVMDPDTYSADNTSYTYTFSPAGPVIDQFSNITNFVYGTTYIVTATDGSCTVSSDSFVINNSSGGNIIISGPSSVCVGNTSTAYTSPSSGGVWSSSNSSVLSINSSTGVINSQSPGNTTITYSTASCSSSVDVTVTGSMIVGDPTLCTNNSASYSATSSDGVTLSSGGTWAVVSGSAILSSTTTNPISISKTGSGNIKLSYTNAGCVSYFNIEDPYLGLVSSGSVGTGFVSVAGVANDYNIIDNEASFTAAAVYSSPSPLVNVVLKTDNGTAPDYFGNNNYDGVLIGADSQNQTTDLYSNFINVVDRYQLDKSYFSALSNSLNSGLSSYTSLYNVMTNNSRISSQSTPGNYYLGNIEITFSNPVNNPILHLAGLGDALTLQNGSELLHTAELVLDHTQGGIFTDLVKLSGTSTLEVDNINYKIGSSYNESSYNTSYTNSIIRNNQIETGTGSASGSVQILGTSITKLLFKVYSKNISSTSGLLMGNYNSVDGDAFAIGVTSESPSVCFCYKPGATGGTVLETKHGITALGRAGADNGNWPMARKGAWTALESKAKGFVINRVKFNISNQPVAADGTTLVITAPVEGMMVYDTTNNCLKVYTTKQGDGSPAWHCMGTQTCPD